MFDSNAMADRAALARSRDGGAGPGVRKVYNSSRAYFDAMGHGELSTWQRAIVESRFRWEQTAELAREHFRIACLTCKDGFYHGDEIPF